MVGMYTEKHTRPHKETEGGKTEVEGGGQKEGETEGLEFLALKTRTCSPPPPPWVTSHVTTAVLYALISLQKGPLRQAA